MMRKGLLVIVSSPSGGGKTTILNRLLNVNEFDFQYSISTTTRRPRTGEISGKDYFFISEQEFLAEIDKNEFLEWEHVHQYYYGTPKKSIERCLKEGKIILLDIDVKGGLKIKEKYPNQTISIFFEPPSMEDLVKRLKGRKTETQDEINKRLTRVPFEMQKKKFFDYIIVNDKIDGTVDKVIKIIKKNIS